MGKQYLDPQPRQYVGDGKLYLVALQHGGSHPVAGVPFSNGLAMNGVPVPANVIHQLMSKGARVQWWEYVAGMKVEWHPEGPRACLGEGKADKPKKRGRKPKDKP